MEHNQHLSEFALLFKDLGLNHVIISPGSRNTPLIQMFTSNDYFDCHSIVDERSAGYVALGISRELNEPVGVVTTSGTAVLNLGPAVAEADYLNLPLMILTADRPLEKIQQFNNQAIDQEEVFLKNSRGFMQVDSRIGNIADLNSLVAKAYELASSALENPCGPVHFNFVLAEPLYDPLPVSVFQHHDWKKDKPEIRLDESLKNWLGRREKKSGAPVVLPGGRKKKPDEQEQIPEYPQKVLFLAGMGGADKNLLQVLERFSEKLGAVVIAENISNLPSENFITNPDLVIASASTDELEALMPDLVVTFGGQVVSKRLKLFLQSGNAKIYNLESEPGANLQVLLDYIDGQE
ncbi:MAG: 2-succinyl-5-enolpyruvyl-6-hydroxy-3-cyclohexene-1-carboxylic-acid synthase, partial [Bacteroidales bacterium]|nr:2-succinyl-5-enolpyruvyl-6-hydroxy-3-cyclohexene-1-carboxylic-acid synthase [Bacteroidales bacterium]